MLSVNAETYNKLFLKLFPKGLEKPFSSVGRVRVAAGRPLIPNQSRSSTFGEKESDRLTETILPMAKSGEQKCPTALEPEPRMNLSRDAVKRNGNAADAGLEI